MILNDNIDVTGHPGPDCPEWCVMGVNGSCAGEFEQPQPDAPRTPGWHVYHRRLRHRDGVEAVEIVIYREGGSVYRDVFPVGTGTDIR